VAFSEVRTLNPQVARVDSRLSSASALNGLREPASKEEYEEKEKKKRLR